MGEIEDLAMKVANAYEDHYFDKQKRPVFDAILNSHLSAGDLAGDDDIYEAVAALGRRYPDEFKKFIEKLRQENLLS